VSDFRPKFLFCDIAERWRKIHDSDGLSTTGIVSITVPFLALANIIIAACFVAPSLLAFNIHYRNHFGTKVSSQGEFVALLL